MNAALFTTQTPKSTAPHALVANGEGAPAFAFSGEHALAQYAATGCLNTTFYATAALQLDAVLRLCDATTPDFVARTALWARERGLMKDLPALLVSWLSVADPGLCDAIFDRVIDDGKMLRNFVQVLRSGVVGRKSLGSMPRRLVRRWFENRSDDEVFRAVVGASPSLADIVKLSHPKPKTASREALYAWLLDKPCDRAALPESVRRYDDFRKNATTVLPDVPFLLLTALPLKPAHWRAIAERATFTQLRMNLNAFARHGVFEDRRLVASIARRLSDKKEIVRSKTLPYQLLTTLKATTALPAAIREALSTALEIATRNVPALDALGTAYVCVDVSGSMASPVTGARRGATTVTRCIDVAALIGASVLRRSFDAELLPFEHQVVDLKLDPDAPLEVNARRLAAIGGGGTSCSAPLARLNERRANGGLVLYVSDNESWCDARSGHGHGRGTEMLAQWDLFKRRNPHAKLVCIDLQPNLTTQAHERGDILNVGGFSDAVFDVIAAFLRSGPGPRTWVDAIAATPL